MRLMWSSLLLLGLAAPALAQQRALAPLEVRPTPAFQRAVAAGTRTMTGVPGPAYWQQRANYDIAVTVDPATRLLTGHETVRYTNASPDTLPLVFFHLYQNLFSETAMRGRPVPITGGLTLTALAVEGVALEVDPANQTQTILQGTVLAVRLPQPLLPGASTTFTVDWHFTIPQGEAVPRMGMVDATTGQIAQWYPQIAVYDDLTGWDMRPYLANGEFYLNYGTFDLAVTAPAGTIVHATGTLQNPKDVLPETIRARLADAAEGDDIVHVVTAADFGPGTATRGRAGETLTWRFHAENVRDAAFAFSDHYLWDATSGLVDVASGRRTAVHALYRPVATSWVESARMTKDAIETFSRNIYPYSYPQITSTEGLVGGMEYPMLVFVRNFDTARTTQEVIAHELGHEWFPMMVGSDETAYAWMDEGVNTYITIFANEHYDPASPERADVRQAYKTYTAQTNVGFDLMDAPDAVAMGGGSVGILGYRHPATALLALRAVLGDATYDRALSTYVEQWLFKHPAPFDFFNTFEAVAGQDLDWFWAPWFYGPAISDQAVDFVETHDMGGTHVVITVRNDGTVLSPIKARVTTANGATAWAEAPAAIWFEGKRLVNVEVMVEGEVTRVELDPEGHFADVDPSDDVWTP